MDYVKQADPQIPTSKQVLVVMNKKKKIRYLVDFEREASPLIPDSKPVLVINNKKKKK